MAAPVSVSLAKPTAKPQVAANDVADTIEEPSGFIGKYSKKISEKQKEQEEAIKEQ